MSNLTLADQEAMRDAFEERAASILGKMLFSFSRLDVNLGLMVSWVLWSLGKESQVKNVDTMNFNSKLEFITQYIEVSSNLPSGAREDLAQWLSDAHAAREQRNQFIHGRWASDALRGKALNIVGLPGSDAQRTFEYALGDLEAFNTSVQHLTRRLSKAREQWNLP